MAVPDECRVKMKKTSTAGSHVLIAAQATTARIGQVIDCTQFSSLTRLLRVTSVVLSFIDVLRAKVQGDGELHDVEIQTDRSRMLWLQYIQAGLPDDT